jgi:micrococcal nuclease
MRFVVVLLVLVGVVLGARSAVGGPAEDVRVVRVIDGDTVVVSGGERVRLIGVDTPERGDCFSRAATAQARRLAGGRAVRLRFDAERRDRYGRLLAYVHRASDGVFVNAEMVRHGYARTLTIAPNVRHAGRFMALEREARRTRRGLWRACAG